jgi:hypothetical protein
MGNLQQRNLLMVVTCMPQLLHQWRFWSMLALRFTNGPAAQKLLRPNKDLRTVRDVLIVAAVPRQ